MEQNTDIKYESYDIIDFFYFSATCLNQMMYNLNLQFYHKLSLAYVR